MATAIQPTCLTKMKRTTVAQIRERILDAKPVKFHGYDGKIYTAIVLEYRRKIATIRYWIFTADHSVRYIRAYISDLNRIEVI